ncbi:MAG: DUF1214 domain-containing protein [Novosphingobium sp.]|nr:DUF1214 domain-containing protein [Novosphingobium sp.]
MSNTTIGPLFDYLGALEEAVDEIANTWRPDDPEYRADVYRQIMMQLSYGYFAFFHADAEHPDWAPLWNPVYTLQPNPDDIYLYAPISVDHSYRLSGNRGTVKMLTINSQAALPGLGETDSTGTSYSDMDDGDLTLDADGNFDLLISAERPAGHTGDWLQIKPGAKCLMTRYRSYDWLNEIDPVMSIECLTATGPKKRLTPEEILERIKQMAAMPVAATKLFYAMQNQVKTNVGLNVFEPQRLGGALSRQIYIPAVYDFEDDEALIVETDLPEQRRYWNWQINDPYFNTVEYVYRLSSTNGHFAHVASDGRFYGVLALKDPGVPNWLDTAGYKQGTIYGRWYDCDSHPTPTLKRVKFSEIRDHLPADTPAVTPEQRAEELAARVRGAQRRRRW